MYRRLPITRPARTLNGRRLKANPEAQAEMGPRGASGAVGPRNTIPENRKTEKVVRHSGKNATSATGQAIGAQSAGAKASHNAQKAEADHNPEVAKTTNQRRNQYES